MRELRLEMQRLNVSLLGSFEVRLDDTDVTDLLRTKKERAILAYLAQEADRAHMRQSVAEFFWPDRPENYARMNLRQALLGIRRMIGPEEKASEFLFTTEETVQIEREKIWLDTNEFTNKLMATHSHSHTHLQTCPECLNALESTVQIYRGDFLEDLLLNDLAGFQEWVFFHRERNFRYLLDALHSLTEIYFKKRDYETTYKHAWRYVSLAPLEEAAHRMLMRVFALTGRRSAALQQYQLCKSLMERELRIEPSVETKRLYEHISAGLSLDKIDTGSLANGSVPPRPAQPRPRQTGPLYDPFTHIPMRALYMDRLQHAVIRMQRDQQKLAVCMVMVSYPLNQNMLPELKKHVEQHVVSRLLGSVRKGDTVARLEDDLFALILEAIRDPRDLDTITQKLITNVGSPILTQGQRIVLKLVLGGSVFPVDGMDPVVLLEKADTAMREARIKQASFFYPSSD